MSSLPLVLGSIILFDVSGHLVPKQRAQVYLDLFQEGVVGLVEAVERFEPERELLARMTKHFDGGAKN